MTSRCGVWMFAVLTSALFWFALCGCGGSNSSGSSQPPPPPPPVTPDYQHNLSATSAWLATQTLPDGAILYSSTEIDPYFSNLAATGWLADSSRIPAVEAWMKWYLAHLNQPDSSGLHGTIYNYNVSSGAETSTGDYDSADSYAATFLSLAEALWNTGDQEAQKFLQGLSEQDFLSIAGAITSLQQANGLVYAKADYKVEYLMDNSEDYRGLADFAALLGQAWNDTAAAAAYNAYAASIQAGIQNVLYIPAQGLYYPYAGSAAPNMITWYPDSVAQLFPITNGVIAATGAQAQKVYGNFNAAWPGWPQLSFKSQDSFPWCVTGYAGYLMNDTTHTNAYLVSIQNQYVNASPQFPWPFYSAEAGWFMRANAGMAAQK